MFYFALDAITIQKVETLKKAKQSDVEKVALSIIKDAVKTHPHHKMFHGASTDKDNHVWVSNCFLMMKIDSPIELPTLPECENAWLKYWEVESSTQKRILSVDCASEDLPAYGELKAELIKARTEARETHNSFSAIAYTTHSGTTVNVRYLMWAIKATGSQTVKTTGKRGMIIIEGNGVHFFVLPINSCYDRTHGYHTIR